MSHGHGVPEDTVDFTSEGHSARYKDGHWGAMDYSGTWIDGYKATILFAPSPSVSDDLVVYVRMNEAFPGLKMNPCGLNVFFEGESLVRWTVYTRFEVIICKAVARRLMAGKKACRLELQTENPQSPNASRSAAGERMINEDPRELGVKVQNVTFTGTERLSYSLGERSISSKMGKAPITSMSAGRRRTIMECGRSGRTRMLILLLRVPAGEPLSPLSPSPTWQSMNKIRTWMCMCMSTGKPPPIGRWDPRGRRTSAPFFCPKDFPLQIRC